MSCHLLIVSRHPNWTQFLASPRNLRLGALVLLLITVNQIDEPLVDPTYGEAFLYWGLRPIVLAAGLWLADWWVTKYFSERLNSPEWLKPVVLVSLVGLVPLAMTEAVLELHLPFLPEFVDDELWAWSPPLAILGELVTLASIVIPIHLLLWLIIDRTAAKPAFAPEAEPQPEPEFLKLSSSRKAKDVLALQAEEHYLRIFSDDGAELVHYRFGNAVDEMPAALGLQVHRSWWVAENAIRSAQRGSRRWQLDLVTDISVPVSDSYVAAVRERGWLKKKPRI